jgi:predicted nucleic acid-binding protein
MLEEPETAALWRSRAGEVAGGTLGTAPVAVFVATCGALEIEALYSARNGDDYERMQAMRASILTYLDTDESDWQRALTVQKALASSSQHKGPRVPDLLIAAVAERYGLILLHYDSDFDRIAAATGQRAEWVVPRGSVP